MFTPLSTSRLRVRAFTVADVEGLVERRNDPQVAFYQNWEMPFTRERADELTSELVAMTGPEKGEWWMAIVEDGSSGETLGDLALHLSENGKTAEVGYTFFSRHWSRGYAVESLSALIQYVFEELGVHRVTGLLHPDNPASAMVLERCGLLFEGHTRESFWLGGEVSDDWIYGMTRSDWETWVGRPSTQPESVRFVGIDTDNYEDVWRLRTHKSQERFVATMPESFTDALFPEVVDGAPVTPWMRAIEADGELVGFVMLALTTEHHPEPFLWRLLIDRLHQRRGIGGRTIELLAEECLSMGDTTLLVSWGEGKGSPEPFYKRHGFVPTGRMVDDEVEARKQLRSE